MLTIGDYRPTWTRTSLYELHRDSDVAEKLLTVHDFPFKVAEWTDEAGFQAIAAKYIRLRPHTEIEKNKTYIVTTIVVRHYVTVFLNTQNECVQNKSV